MSFTIKVKEGISVLFVVIHSEPPRWFTIAGFIQIYHWAFKNNFENKYSISYYINQYKLLWFLKAETFAINMHSVHIVIWLFLRELTLSLLTKGMSV